MALGSVEVAHLADVLLELSAFPTFLFCEILGARSAIEGGLARCKLLQEAQPPNATATSQTHVPWIKPARPWTRLVHGALRSLKEGASIIHLPQHQQAATGGQLDERLWLSRHVDVDRRQPLQSVFEGRPSCPTSTQASHVGAGDGHSEVSAAMAAGGALETKQLAAVSHGFHVEGWPGATVAVKAEPVPARLGSRAPAPGLLHRGSPTKHSRNRCVLLVGAKTNGNGGNATGRPFFRVARGPSYEGTIS